MIMNNKRFRRVDGMLLSEDKGKESVIVGVSYLNGNVVIDKTKLGLDTTLLVQEKEDTKELEIKDIQLLNTFDGGKVVSISEQRGIYGVYIGSQSKLYLHSLRFLSGKVKVLVKGLKVGLSDMCMSDYLGSLTDILDECMGTVVGMLQGIDGIVSRLDVAKGVFKGFSSTVTKGVITINIASGHLHRYMLELDLNSLDYKIYLSYTLYGIPSDIKRGYRNEYNFLLDLHSKCLYVRKEDKLGIMETTKEVLSDSVDMSDRVGDYTVTYVGDTNKTDTEMGDMSIRFGGGEYSFHI